MGAVMKAVTKVVVTYTDGTEETIEGNGHLQRHSTTVDVEDPVTNRITVKPVKFVTIGMPCD